MRWCLQAGEERDDKKWEGSGVDVSKIAGEHSDIVTGARQGGGEEKRALPLEKMMQEFELFSCYSVLLTKNILPYVVSSAQVQPNRGRPYQKEVGGGDSHNSCMLHLKKRSRGRSNRARGHSVGGCICSVVRRVTKRNKIERWVGVPATSCQGSPESPAGWQSPSALATRWKQALASSDIKENARPNVLL